VVGGVPDPTPASFTWTIDQTAPDTYVTGGPNDPSTSVNAAFTFDSDESGVSYECSLDSGAFTACANPATFTSLAEGPHNLSVRAKDAAGNVDGSPAQWAWTVDTTAPDTSITSGPTGIVNATTASFGFSSTETGSTFECQLDLGSWTSCPSPKGYSALSEGSHTFAVRATDAAGNVDASPATRSWTVDTTAPTVSLTATPPSVSGSTSASFTFSSTDSGASFLCSVDGGTFGPCTSPDALTGLAEGSHTFAVKAVDAAGNESAPASYGWTVDTTVPDTTLTGGPSGLVNTDAASFTFSASESGATFECKLDSGSWGACTSPADFASLGEGSHTFSVRATDTAGNTDASPASRTWTVDTQAPDTAIDSGPAALVNVSTASLAFSSADGGATFECQVDSGSWAACTSPSNLTGLTDGSHTFVVRAIDAAGNTDASPAARTWTVDTQAPDTAIDSGPAALVNVSTASLAFSSADTGATFECQLETGSCAA
jgi:hypothetical protein